MKRVLALALATAATYAAAASDCDANKPGLRCVNGEPYTMMVDSAPDGQIRAEDSRAAPIVAHDAQGVAHTTLGMTITTKGGPQDYVREPYRLGSKTTIDASGSSKSCIISSYSQRCVPVKP